MLVQSRRFYQKEAFPWRGLHLTTRPSAAQGILSVRALAVVALLVWAVRAAPKQEPMPSESEMAAWIADLSSKEFKRRESAEARLTEAGTASIGPLVEVAKCGAIESSVRAFRVLENLLRSDDYEVHREAIAALNEIERLARTERSRKATEVLLREEREAMRALKGKASFEFHPSGKVRRVANDPGFEQPPQGLEDGDIAHLRAFTEIVDLDLGGAPTGDSSSYLMSRITDKGIARLPRLETVRHLDLEGTVFTDAGLATILERVRELTSLMLNNDKITNEGIKALAKLRNLATLEIHHTAITDLGAMGEIPSLTKLTATDMPLGDDGLRNLHGLSNLRDLTLYFYQSDGSEFARRVDKILGGLKGPKKLERLHLTNTHVGDDGLACLRGFPELRELDINSTLMTDEGLRHIGALPELRVLKVSGRNKELSGEGFRHLDRLVALRSLIFSAPALVPDAIRYLPDLPQLEELCINFSGAATRGEYYRALSSMKNLRKISFLPLNDAALRHLEHASSLESVCFVLPSITDAGIVSLSKLTSLKELHLEKATLSDSSMRLLATLPKLEVLSLLGASFTEAGVEHLAQSSSIRVLNLNRSSVTDAGVDALVKLPTLDVLYLDESAVTPQATARFKKRPPTFRVK